MPGTDPRSTKRRVGRPSTGRNGRDIKIYMDAESISAAARIGDGSVSAGVRLALKTYINQCDAQDNSNAQKNFKKVAKTA